MSFALFVEEEAKWGNVGLLAVEADLALLLLL